MNACGIPVEGIDGRHASDEGIWKGRFGQRLGVCGVGKTPSEPRITRIKGLR